MIQIKLTEWGKSELIKFVEAHISEDVDNTIEVKIDGEFTIRNIGTYFTMCVGDDYTREVIL